MTKIPLFPGIKTIHFSTVDWYVILPNHYLPTLILIHQPGDTTQSLPVYSHTHTPTRWYYMITTFLLSTLIFIHQPGDTTQSLPAYSHTHTPTRWYYPITTCLFSYWYTSQLILPNHYFPTLIFINQPGDTIQSLPAYSHTHTPTRWYFPITTCLLSYLYTSQVTYSQLFK